MPRISRRSLLAGTAGTLAAAPLPQATQPRLNLIHIGVDTWATHWLGCYGNTSIKTPSVDALARKSLVFADAYPEVLPTIPARRAIYTGRRIFPSQKMLQRDDQVKIRGWHQLYTEDITIAETLQSAGYTTAIVSDVYHQFKPDKNFHRGFDSWRWIRGQESDRLESGPRSSIELSRYWHASQPKPAAQKANGVLQYLLNRRDWKTEDDWLTAQVFREASRWVENNAAENQPFYLHVESFSPHEFWDPPESFYRMYMKSDYRGPRLISPPMTTAQITDVEVEHVRALYAGLVSFVDDRIGKFLAKVESLGLLRNTVVVFVADHGTMLGEQGQLHKGEQRLRTQCTHVPLMICWPGLTGGRRVEGFVQHTDVMPTVLDLLGVKAPGRVTGRPLTESATAGRADLIVTGWGEHGCVRTHEWCYIGRWSSGPPFEQLYDVQRDPLELKNVADGHPSVIKDLRAKLKSHVDSGWEITKGTFATRLETA